MIITTLKQFEDLCSLIYKNKIVFLDTETTGLSWDDRLLGISIATGSQDNLITAYLEWDTLPVDALLDVVQSPYIKKVFHNAKFDMKILMRNGFIFDGPLFDTMVAYWFLDPKYKGVDLKGLMKELFDIDSPDYKELLRLGGTVTEKKQKNGKIRRKCVPAKNLTEVPLDVVAKYAENDVRYTAMLYDYCLKELESHPGKELLYKIDLPLIKVLANMELAGISVNTKSMEEQSKQMGREILVLEAKLRTICGRDMNLNSNQQLGQYLFNEVKLKPYSYTGKTKAPTVDDYSLKRYSKEGNEFCTTLLEYRKLTKTKKTYLDSLVLKADHSGRVHANFNINGTATGRLSCSSPNLQNIPKEGAIGDAIRECFISSPGHALIRADFSQMELRMTAHLAQDRRMIWMLRNGGDFHIDTAKFMFPDREITKESPERSAAKTVNFGASYGLTPQTMAKDLDITFDEAQAFFDAHRRTYPSVNRLKWRLRDEVHKTKSITTIFGRRRDLSKSSGNVENQALNTPVQGACSDVMKEAMLRLYNALLGTQWKLVLQVHDEVILEGPADEAAEMSVAVKNIMESANVIFFETIPSFIMTCPFEVETKYGKNWKEAH